MSLLFKHLRVHQVFGANTDVGKTIITTALVRAAAAAGNVFYLKPVSTGSPDSADVQHVELYAGKHKSRIHTECLYQYQEPVSPHLAARLASNGDESLIPTDAILVNSIAHHVRQCASKVTNSSSMYVETAGGVHSPVLSGTTQVECYRPLFLPTVLVGDSKLGGISSTISACESLLLRGYIIDAVLLFQDERYRNWEYLHAYFTDRGVHMSAITTPPAILPDPIANQASTEDYYGSITASDSTIMSVIRHLDGRHSSRLEELHSMPRRTLDTIWWPFVQHAHYQKESDVKVIDSAHSDFFSILDHSPDVTSSLLQPQFDGSASWWTQAFGHADSSLTLAAARASGRYGHVMFPRATHLPALRLAERLVKDGPGRGWASRAYFSDDGSTAMEVALKMALRAYTVRYGKQDTKSLGILGLKGSYHGDTIGAMNACEEGVYTCEWHEAKGYWLDSPTVGFKGGKFVISVPPSFTSQTMPDEQLQGETLSWAYDVPSRLESPLAGIYKTHIQNVFRNLQAKGIKLGALVLEPLVLGAGGMLFVDPLFQRLLVDAVRGSSLPPSKSWSGLPVIFDEVFVGLYRIGLESTTSILGVQPDISVNAKVLTGGLVPLAVTLASRSIFEAFFSDDKKAALLHGHSYTAHAVGCEVANEVMGKLDRLKESEAWREAKDMWGEGKVWSFWDPRFVETISGISTVDEVMTMGTVLALKLKDENAGYISQSAEAIFSPIEFAHSNDGVLSSAPGGASFGVHYRTLGNVAYFMTSLTTPKAVLRALEDKIYATLHIS